MKNSHFYPECPKRNEKVIISFEILRVSKSFMYQYLITSPCYNCGKNLSDWTIITACFQSWKLWKIAFGTYMVLKNRDVHSKFLYALKVISKVISKQMCGENVAMFFDCPLFLQFSYDFWFQSRFWVPEHLWRKWDLKKLPITILVYL